MIYKLNLWEIFGGTFWGIDPLPFSLSPGRLHTTRNGFLAAKVKDPPPNPRCTKTSQVQEVGRMISTPETLRYESELTNQSFRLSSS